MSDAEQLTQAANAIQHGAVWRGFDGPDGITKDEALEYAGQLADGVPHLLAALEAERVRNQQLTDALARIVAPATSLDPMSDRFDAARVLLAAAETRAALGAVGGLSDDTEPT